MLNSWRKLFKGMKDQLVEIDGCDVPEEEKKIDHLVDEEYEVKRKQIKLSKQLDFNIEGDSICIDYVNISKVKISYYVIELETLFSKTPFMTQVL